MPRPGSGYSIVTFLPLLESLIVSATLAKNQSRALGLRVGAADHGGVAVRRLHGGTAAGRGEQVGAVAAARRVPLRCAMRVAKATLVLPHSAISALSATMLVS